MINKTLLMLTLTVLSYSSHAQSTIYESGGNVGIGTTNPTAKLDVQGGNISIGNTTDVSRALQITTSPTASAILLIGNKIMNTEITTNFSGSTDAYGIPTNTIGFGNAFNYPMVFTTNAKERFRISEIGNIGIGTINPLFKLDIQGGNMNIGNTTDVSRGLSITTSPTASATLLIGNKTMNTEFTTNFSGSTDAYGIPTNTIGFGNAFNYPMVFTTNAIERFRIGENGNAGFGTNNLQAKFNVYQSATLGSNPKNSTLLSTVSGISGISNAFQNNLWLVRNITGDNWLSTRLHDGISVDGSFLSPQIDTRTWWERDPDKNIQSWGDQANTYLTINNGNIGIGTVTPDEKLAVNGTIHSREVKVDVIGFPDYVFNQSYHLTSLGEIETYIQKKHHLPEMPSAQQVDEQGLNLGEINKLLTKKVEELTLYLIAKDKELTDEKGRNDVQQEQINQLKEQVDLILKKH